MYLRLLTTLSLLLVAACGSDDQSLAYDLTGSTMGTRYTVTLVVPSAPADLERLGDAVQDALEAIEDIASTYRPASEVSLFNANPSTDWIDVSPQLCGMVAAALEIAHLSNGAFDITVGPLVNLWGFGPVDSMEVVPGDEEIASARSLTGYENLQADCENNRLIKRHPETYVDLSGWAKGFAVDEIARLLDAADFENYLVEIGGELRLRGHNRELKDFSIAIEKPVENNTMSYFQLSLSDVSVASSGDYRNYWTQDSRRFSHTIDPRTGWPIDHSLTGVTVVAESTAYADAMATALLVLGPEDGPALAEKLKLAAYFQARSDRGLAESFTSEFNKLRQL